MLVRTIRTQGVAKEYEKLKTDLAIKYNRDLHFIKNRVY